MAVWLPVELHHLPQGVTEEDPKLEESQGLEGAGWPALKDRNQSLWVQPPGTALHPAPSSGPHQAQNAPRGGAEPTGGWRVRAGTWQSTQHGPEQGPDTPSTEAALGRQDKAADSAHIEQPAHGNRVSTQRHAL